MANRDRSAARVYEAPRPGLVTAEPSRSQARPRPGDPREELRGALVAAREERSPEGLSATRTARFYSLLFAGLFGAVMIGAIALTLASSFGWAALAVGVLLLLAYIVVGGGPEWIAGRMRARERRQIEDEVTIDLRGFEREGPDGPE